MKNAKAYEAKVKKVIKKKKAVLDPVTDQRGWLPFLIHAILLNEATEAQATRAAASLRREFSDYNELRVAPFKDIVECLGNNFPKVRQKAAELTTALAGVFGKAFAMNMDYAKEMKKREIRQHFRVDLKLGEFSEALISCICFGVHAIPVSDALQRAMRLNGLVSPDADAHNTQAFLERIIPQKDALGYIESLLQYEVGNAKIVQKDRREEEKENNRLRLIEEEKARVIEEELARIAAEAEAKRLAEREAKRLIEEEKKAAKAAKLAEEKAAKKAASAAKTKATRAAKRAEQKAIKEAEKAAVEKAEAKAAKKTAKKPTGKAVKKPAKKTSAKTTGKVHASGVAKSKSKPAAKKSAAKKTVKKATKKTAAPQDRQDRREKTRI